MSETARTQLVHLPVAAAPLTRHADWERRLSACFARLAATPFKWGVMDCLTAPADCVHAMTDVDPLAPYRGLYASRAEADALLAALAPDVVEGQRLSAVVAAVMRAHGAPTIPPAFARTGDVAIARWPDAERDRAPAEHCGIVAGVNLALPYRTGLKAAPLRRAVTAWRVG